MAGNETKNWWNGGGSWVTRKGVLFFGSFIGILALCGVIALWFHIGKQEAALALIGVALSLWAWLAYEYYRKPQRCVR